MDKELLMNRLGGSTRLLERVIDQFEKSSSSQMAVLREAVRMGDVETLTRAVHRLKGMVSYFEDLPVNEAAGRLMKMAEANDMFQAAAACEELDEVVKLLRLSLRALLQ